LSVVVVRRKAKLTRIPIIITKDRYLGMGRCESTLQVFNETKAVWFSKAEPQRQRWPGNIRNEILTTKRQAGVLRTAVSSIITIVQERERASWLHWCLQDGIKTFIYFYPKK